MSAAKDIDWRVQNDKKTKPETSFLEYCSSLPILTDQRIEQFVRQCHSNGDETALGTILFATEKRRRTNIRDQVFLASWYDVKYRYKTLTELVEIGTNISLSLTSNEVKEISTITLPSSKSKCRVALKRGRITGSIFKKCCLSDIKDPCLATVRRAIHITKVVGCAPSIRVKKKSLQLYVKELDTLHTDLTFDESGLIIVQCLPYFVGSPDGLISCTCHGKGCIKAKYLSTLQDDTSLEAFTRKPDGMLVKNGEQYFLAEDHEFHYDAQLQIHLSGSNYCDYVIYSSKKALSVRVFPDKNFWMCAMGKALRFHDQVLKPELLAKFFTNKKGKYQS